LGRVDEAIEICQRGLEHHPDFHSGRVALARCYLEKRRYQDAQFECEKVVQLAPENLLAQKILGDALEAQGLQQAALHAFKMALLLSPCDIGLSEKVHQLEKEQPKFNPPSTPQEAIQVQPFSDDSLESSLLGIPKPEERISVLSGEGQFEDFPVPEEEISEETIEQENIDTSQKVEAILGFVDETEETFSVGTLSNLFKTEEESNPLEITTETLGDLYFRQGQFLHALKIFEKISRQKKTPELDRKIKSCRVRLGVDAGSIIRQKKIAILRGVLEKLHNS